MSKPTSIYALRTPGDAFRKQPLIQIAQIPFRGRLASVTPEFVPPVQLKDLIRHVGMSSRLNAIHVLSVATK
jgi:hypothetical protein